MLVFCFLLLPFCFFAFLQSVFTAIQIFFARLVSWINSRPKRYHLFWLSHFWLCYDCFTHTFHFLVVLGDLLSTSWVKSQSTWKLRCKINSSYHFLCIEVSFTYLDLFLQSQWSFPWFFVCHSSKNSHNQKLKLSMASWCLDASFETFTFEIHWKLHYLQQFNWNFMFLSSKFHSNQVVECIIFVWVKVKFQFWFIVPDSWFLIPYFVSFWDFAILIPDSWFQAKHEWHNRVFPNSKCRIPLHANYSYEMCLETRLFRAQNMCCEVTKMSIWYFNNISSVQRFVLCWMYHKNQSLYQVCLFIVVKHVMKNSLILKPFDFCDRSNLVLYKVWNWLRISFGGFFGSLGMLLIGETICTSI